MIFPQKGAGKHQAESNEPELWQLIFVAVITLIALGVGMVWFVASNL